jgi:hypothetical protein
LPPPCILYSRWQLRPPGARREVALAQEPSRRQFLFATLAKAFTNP